MPDAGASDVNNGAQQTEALAAASHQLRLLVRQTLRHAYLAAQKPEERNRIQPIIDSAEFAAIKADELCRSINQAAPKAGGMAGL